MKLETEPAKIGKVLIVEDNDVNQQYLMGLLEKWQIGYDLANHGLDALELIEENCYDLILMDIRMPVMDGYETTARIRSNTSNPNCGIPIIAITATTVVDQKELTLESGMNYHLSKPFSPDQLLDIFHELNYGPKAEEVVAEYAFSTDLDYVYLDEFYMKDLERAAIVFRIFLRNIDKELADLEEYFESGDWESFSSLAHRIKPNFSMVGLTEYTGTMKEFELLGNQKNEKKLSKIVPAFLRDFKEKHEIVKEELNNINQYLNQ